MTTEHNVLTDPELHEPKGLAAATVGQILVADGAASGTWQNALPLKEITINVEADFPTQDGTTITLESGFKYKLSDNLSTSKRFVVENESAMEGLGIRIVTLTYTGSGVMFTGVNATFTLQNIELVCGSASETYNFDDTTPLSSVIVLRNINIVATAKIGSFKNVQSLIVESVSCIDATQGIALTGTQASVVSFAKNAFFSTSATFIGIDFGSTVGSVIEFMNLFLIGPSGAFGIKGLAASGNIASGSVGVITNSEFLGAITPFSGIDPQEDIRWRAEGNSANVPDTRKDALASMTTNATNTVIAGASTPVKLAGSTYVDQRSSSFGISTSGTVTYNGEKDLTVPIIVTVSATVVSGTNKILKIYIAINGTVITPTGMPLQTNSGDPKVFTTIWQPTLSTTDFIEVFMSNETDTVDIIATDVIIMVA